MQRTKLADRILPTYTKGEEIFNMTSHIVGGALGIVVTTLCVIMAAKHRKCIWNSKRSNLWSYDDFTIHNI